MVGAHNFPRRTGARGLTRAACGAAMLALAWPAAGASSGGEAPLQLPPWEVSESRLLPTAVPIRATAVLPAASWSGRNIWTLADAIRHIPGAVMQESFGGFEPPRLSIRGSGLQSAPSSRGIVLMMDQMTVGLADGSFNSALFDPLMGGEVRIHRGIDAWREGPTVLGGAMDLRTEARGGGDRALLRIQAGSFGGLRVLATGSADTGVHAGRATFSWTRQDGFRERSAQQRTGFLVSGERAAGNGRTFSAGLFHARARYEVPGPLTLGEALANPRSVSAAVQRDLPRRDSGLTRLTAGYAGRTEFREMEFGLGVGRTGDEFFQLQPNGVTRLWSTDIGWRGMMAQRFMGWPGPHQVRLQATGAHGWRRQTRHVNAAGVSGAEFASDRLRPETVAVSLEDRIGLSPSIVGTLGIAQLLASRPLPGGLPRRTAIAMPQAGITWRVTPRTALHASVVAGAEPPTYDDMLVVGGTHPALERRVQPLEAQRATTAEVGARGEAGTLAWDLSVYRGHWRDEILRLADATGAARGAVNATPTTHEGVEASLRWKVLAGDIGVTLAASTVWTRCTFEGDPVYGRNRLAGVPPHVGDVEVVMNLPGGRFLAAGADWRKGVTAVDHAGRLGFDGCTLAHVRGGWRMRDGWAIHMEVRNLLDRRSIASSAGVLDLARNPAATSIFLPAAGRSLAVGVEWRR